MPAQDAIALLKADHKVVKQLFSEFKDLGDRAFKTKQDVVAQICEELTVHASIEEEVFYPRVRKVGEEEKDSVLEGIEEHAIIKELVAELGTLNAEDETFDAKVKVLIEQVEHHVEEEETEVFPAVQKALPKEELVALGERLAEMKAGAKSGSARG
jgi:hemerythrin superfamily protein